MSYNHKTVVSPSKIPLSPNRGKRVTPQLRTSQFTDSAVIHSLASSQLRIPNLIDSEFSQKITLMGKINVFKRVPLAVQEYEQKMLEYVMYQNDVDAVIDVNVDEKFSLQYANREYFAHSVDYLNQVPDQIPAFDLYVEEVLGLPRAISSTIRNRFMAQIASNDARKFLEKTQADIDMEMLTFMQNTYNAVKDMQPEKRLYYIFDGKLTYQNVLDFCRNVVDCQKDFDFV